MSTSEKDREAAWEFLKQRSWSDELTLGEAESSDKMLGEWYFGSSAIADLAEALATARAEGYRAGLERAKALCLDAVPRAHSYASENADLYRAGDGARDLCIEAIDRALAGEDA